MTGQTLLSTASAAEDIVLESEHVSGNVYCISGQGGNTAVLKSEDGLLVVDSKYGSVANTLLETIRSISTKPVRYLVNTHYHGDHTGGNEIIGEHAEIVMHPACKSTKMEFMRMAAMQEGYLADVKTWSDGMKIVLGEETVRLLHFGSGHTLGDLVVVFETSRVVHTGDLFFHGRPPFIDIDDSPDTENWIRTIGTLCREYPDYLFIPGHGEVADASALLEFGAYLRILREEVVVAIHEGKSKEEAMNTIDLTHYPLFRDPEEKRSGRIMRNVDCVYDEMTRQPQE
jgi:glyoxylase-like metal-dependent hydrolase (beta-lactamase superfamily II)